MAYLIFVTIGFFLVQDLAAFQLSEILFVEDVKHMDSKKISSIEKMLSKKLEEKIMIYDEALKSQTKEVLARYLADLSFSERLKQSLSVQQAIATTEAPTTNCDTGTVKGESVVDIITGAPNTVAPITNAPITAAVYEATEAASTEASTVAATTIPATRRPTVDPGHVLNQVDKILNNVAGGNIVGIVDESLRIRAPEPVRGLVTGILEIIFCNPIDRLFNRCRQKGAGAVAGK